MTTASIIKTVDDVLVKVHMAAGHFTVSLNRPVTPAASTCHPQPPEICQPADPQNYTSQ